MSVATNTLESMILGQIDMVQRAATERGDVPPVTLESLSGSNIFVWVRDAGGAWRRCCIAITEAPPR